MLNSWYKPCSCLNSKLFSCIWNASYLCFWLQNGKMV